MTNDLANCSDAPSLNTLAAAKYLGMHHTTLRAWRHRGIGPAFVKYDAGTVRYRLRDLEEFSRRGLSPMLK